jgi:hypothetical protein
MNELSGDIMPRQLAPLQHQATVRRSLIQRGAPFMPRRVLAMRRRFFLFGDYPLTVGWGQHGKEQWHAEAQ